MSKRQIDKLIIRAEYHKYGTKHCFKLTHVDLDLILVFHLLVDEYQTLKKQNMTILAYSDWQLFNVRCEGEQIYKQWNHAVKGLWTNVFIATIKGGGILPCNSLFFLGAAAIKCYRKLMGGNRQWTIQKWRQHWAQDTDQRQTKQKPQHRKLKRPKFVFYK